MVLMNLFVIRDYWCPFFRLGQGTYGEVDFIRGALGFRKLKVRRKRHNLSLAYPTVGSVTPVLLPYDFFLTSEAV